jgi:GMP synthase (glutamine-hydrolysing)
VVDILTRELDDSLLEEADVFFVGGSGEFSVLDDVPQVRAFVDYLAMLVDRRVPLFASCFGFQAMVLGLGGEVIRDEPNSEVGSFDLQTTPDGTKDELFSVMPPTFVAQLGHKDRATRLPSGMLCLASSERAPFQALRVCDAPIYGTQFHPELTDEDNRRRFQNYMDEYGRLFGREEAQRLLDSHRPSPESNSLLRRFVDHVVETRL